MFTGDPATLPAMLKSPVDLVRLLPGQHSATSPIAAAAAAVSAANAAAAAAAAAPPSSEDSLTASTSSIGRKDKVSQQTQLH